MVGELQGTNQDEEKEKVANPFWDKLHRRTLESRIQEKHHGGAYLWHPITKRTTLLVEYAHDAQPDTKHTVVIQTAGDWVTESCF